MRLQPTLVSLSLACCSIACDAADPFEHAADEPRSGTLRDPVMVAFFDERASCPSYSCGLNSPFIGHELSLAGDANDQDVKLLYAEHLKHGPATVQVLGDELVADAGGATISGHDLVGLRLVLEGEVDGLTVLLTAKLVEVATVRMWTDGLADVPPMVPTYKFVYSAPGIANQLLCPAPKEGVAPDPDAISLAEVQGDLFDAGKLGDLWDLNEQLAGTDRAYHSVVFSGERFDFDTAEIYADDALDWFNWGCAGSSAAKLHLTGHTSAADARLGSATPVTPEIRQSVLYAYTAAYCPGGRLMTVPGHPIRLADVRGVLARDGEVSFAPRASGTVEALWGPEGAQCLSTPRLTTDGIDVWEEILQACPSLPPCPDGEEFISADQAGNLLHPWRPVATFNLAADSCQGRCGTAGPDWDCKPSCVSGGTCSSDYVHLCM